MQANPPGSRHYLSQPDLSFILDALTEHGQERQALSKLLCDPEVIDEVLDQPGLYAALFTGTLEAAPSPQLYFYVIVRHAFREIGLEDRGVAEYVGNMLAELGHSDTALPALRDSGQSVLYSIDYWKLLDQASVGQRFFVHASAGNHYLFMTGLFARHLEHKRQRQGAPGVDFYEQMGQQSYASARDHRLAREYDLESTFDALVQRFPEARRKLNEYADFLHALN